MEYSVREARTSLTASRGFVVIILDLFLPGPRRRIHLALDSMQSVKGVIESGQADNVKAQPVQPIQDVHQDGRLRSRRVVLLSDSLVHPLEPDTSEFGTLEFEGRHHPPDIALAKQRVDDPANQTVSRSLSVDETGAKIPSESLPEH
jgi:hypothetical protein